MISHALTKLQPYHHLLGALSRGDAIIRFGGRFTFSIEHVEYEVMTYIFWDMTPCSPLKVNRRYVGDRTPQPSGLKSEPRHQHEAGSTQGLASGFSHDLTLQP
jgi:hypothetical protein